MLAHPAFSKTVMESFVEIVHLPDVFMEHPVVKVEDKDNEMVIKDVFTDEFIAKKIIYD